MGIVVIRNDNKTELWTRLLREKAPDVPVYAYETDYDPEKIRLAAVWKHPPGSLGKFPRLMGVQGLGAGVDFILEDSALDKALPVMRIVDPFLAADMAEYVLAQLMAYLREVYQHAVDKSKKIWKPTPYRRIGELQIGIMGMGQLGRAVAELLLKTGFSVRGWARTRHQLDFPMYSGGEGMDEFLSGSDVLVCLLPLTPETRGILGKNVFDRLPNGTFLVNVARGPLLNEQDLLDALGSGRLSAACLDVFHEEPLPAAHPFWEHPGVYITPHVASITDPGSVAAQVIANYRALLRGAAPTNLVDRKRGY